MSRNITPKISGIVPLWSFFSGLCGGMIGLLATLMIGLDIGPVQGFIALGCFTLFFSIHRAIIGGRYDYEFLDEKSMLRYKKKSSIEIDIEKKATLRKSRVPKDRFFLSPMGLAVIGFGIDESKIINFDTFMQNLMSKQKQGVRIRYMKKSSKGKGKIEPELTFLDSEIKIFIEVSNVSISRDDIITSFWNSLELYGSPLSLDEIRIFVKEMIAPGRSISEWEIKDGIFPSPLSLIRSEATLHYGDVAKQAGIISLAQLAVSISGNFQKILDVLGTLEGTICVTLESLGDQGVGAAIIRKQVEELDSKDKHDSEKEKTVASKFKLNSKLSIIALLHGSTEDLKNVEKELDANYRAIPSDELPYWRREYALFEKALDSMLPGHPITLPERRQRRIIDSQEASMYFPKPTYKGLDNPVVELKTASGQRFGFRLRKKYPLFIWSGVGDGKSVVLGYITKNYILRSKEGQKIATFTM
ncbi:MAG: hypothetical protein MK086_14820, partial [Flavobacteriales bacterium]|nr:hypothetical protein [Flavobacteriales bacterium]